MLGSSVSALEHAGRRIKAGALGFYDFSVLFLNRTWAFSGHFCYLTKNQRKLDQVMHRSEAMPPEIVYWKFKKENISFICGKMRGKALLFPWTMWDCCTGSSPQFSQFSTEQKADGGWGTGGILTSAGTSGCQGTCVYPVVLCIFSAIKCQ